MPNREDIEKRVVDGSLWNEFCETLKMAGNFILAESTPSDTLNRAEGFRYLSRITRAALETYVEHSDPRAPILRRVIDETSKMGADNPDNYYFYASIHGQYEYRIRGQRGSVQYLGFGAQIGNFGQSRGLPPTGYLEAKDMEIAEDGSFEIILSKQKHPGNWLPIHEEIGTLLVRQTFLDRDKEIPAELTIERIGGETGPTPFDPLTFAEGLQTSGNLVAGAAMLFTSWAEDFQKHKNELPRFNQETSNMAGGDPNIAFYHSYWELQPDEALVITVKPPDCEYWNFQLNNYWMESLDYRYYNIHINNHTAKYREDGSVEIVVAAENLGFDNWLDTAGHTCGTMVWRWLRAETHPRPKTKVVKLSELQPKTSILSAPFRSQRKAVGE